MQSVNVAVEKTGTENNVSLIRRFTRRVQESGIVRRVRGIRYSERNRSHYVSKKKTLEVLSRRKERERLMKLGKISALPTRGPRK
jgi:ribosomal protein S21